MNNEELGTPEQPRPHWTCRLGFHNWSRWTFDQEMTITSFPYGIESDYLKGPSRPATRQKRECHNCGKIQYHVAKT